MPEPMQNPVVPKKSRFSFLKKKSFWIPAILVLLVGGYVLASRGRNDGPFYETRRVERADLVQTVEVTGEVKPEARLNLAFKSTGALERVYVKVGQAVKKGTLLAELESRDLRFSAERARAALAIAQANLDSRLAGATKESIRVAEASVEQARASLEKANVDLDVTKRNVENERRVAELAFSLAEQNLANSGATAEQAVITSYENLRSALQAALGPMRAGLFDGDAIIGVDNTAANDDYESVLGIFDRPSLELAKQSYPTTKLAVTDAERAVRALSSSSSQDATLAAGQLVRTALDKVQLYLSYVQKTLAGTINNANLTQTELDALSAGIDSARASVSTQLTAVVSAYEAARNSDLTRTTTQAQLQNAYDTAKANLDIARANETTKVQTAQTNVIIQEAALAAAEAQLAERKAPPRSVDVAALRAQVLDAQTAYAQASERLADVQIVAPVDGVITDIVPNLGEQVVANATAVSMVTTDVFTVEALVPEADIAKVEPGQKIEMTLDAFGDDVKFAGEVVSENPDQTKVQDAIYYKVYTTIEADGRDIKPGMTANLVITTGERKGALFVPTRSLRARDGQRYVRILENGNVREVDVVLGLRGDEGRTEIVSGLAEGQIVIVSEVSAEEFAQLGEDEKAGN